MPLGKSGKYYSNPSVMRSRADAPDTSPLNTAIAPPDSDGNQDQPVAELTICKYSDGSFGLRSDDGSDEQKPLAADDVEAQVSQFTQGSDDDSTLPSTDEEPEPAQR
jgi:hypothetical protein